MEADGTKDLILYGFFAIVMLGFVLFIGGFVFLFLWALKRREKRINGLKQMAAKIGWNYQPKADLAQVPRHLLDPNKVHSFASVSNFLSGNLNGNQAIAFDYFYKIGFTKDSTASVYTLFALSAPHLNLPKFALCEESFFRKLSWKISQRKDLNFPAYPNFSARFLLDAENEPKVYQTFHPQIIAFYEQNPSFQTLSDGNILLISPNAGVVQAEDYEKWINLLWTLHELFKTSK